jgi:hypothetical protein
MNSRYIPHIGDLNRKFPTKINYDKCKLNPIIKKILNFIKEADFIIDFHEGWGYYKNNNGSIGSTITPTNTELSNNIAEIVYNNLNKTIIDTKKKFTILIDDDYKIKSNFKGCFTHADAMSKVYNPFVCIDKNIKIVG